MKFVRILLALFVLLFEFNSIQAQTVSGTFVYSNDTAQTKFVSFNTYSYRVTYNNAPLYRIDSILIDNIYNGYDSMFGITLNGLGDGITKLLTIKFLDSNSYQINTNVVNGSITKSILVAAGSNYTVTYSRISNNYFLDSIIVDGQKVTTDSVSSYTFTNITKLDHNISVYYNTRITANAIYSNDTSTVRIVKFNYGQYRLMYNTPNNYYLDSIFYNNSFAGLDSLTGYTLNNIRAHSYNYFSTKYILASQAARVFTKVVNGQISSNQVLPLGSAIRITFNPTQYYKLDSIVVDGIQTSLDSVSGYTFKNILSDHTIQVYYSLIPFFNVKTKVTNGVISASDSIRQGNNILITFSPNLNYKLDSIVVDGNIISLSIIGPNVSFTFNNIQTNHTIYVYYSIKPEFNINANVVNGNITPSLATPVFSNVRIEYSPVTANYLLDSVVINNINIGKDSVSGYTFKNIQQNNSIRVYYNTYLTSTVIYTNDTARGTLVKFVNKSFRVNYAIPNGFGLDSIYADNLFVGKDSVTGFTFKNIALGSKHFLTNIFNPTNSVKITTYILNGQISPKTYQALGNNYRVTYNTLNGYVLDSLVVDGVQISRDSISGYTFTNLQTSHTINVYFNLKLNGTIVYSTDTAQTRFVKFNGGYFRVTYNTPNTYRLDNVIADGQNYGPDSTNGFTFNNIQFLIDRYLTVIFSNSPSIKITTQVFNGQITPTQSVSRNSNLRVTYTPNTNYKLDSILVNGINIGKDSFRGYTF
ncbi:MAG: hypothetical protein ORN85_08935, partial [Sediminibacterium sp.]|nr:hypothetical protein [Sediminibacterium sp.]